MAAIRRLAWLVLFAGLLLTGCVGEGATVSGSRFDPWSMTARYEIRYTADLSGMEPGSRVWIPEPAETGFQTVVRKEITAPFPHRETVDSLGNRMIYVETPEMPPDSPQAVRLVARYVVERSPARSYDPAGSDMEGSSARYLSADRLIPLQGPIAAIAGQESAGLFSASEESRAFYDYVLKSMSYKKEGEGWGRGDAIWACTARYGNCTDFHSLLIGLERAQGIPARFLIGLPVPAEKEEGEIPGYHCWAEVLLQGRWLPVDASEAWKSRKHDAYYGALPSDRVLFTRGRDLVLEPPQEGEPLNFFIYPYAESGGHPAKPVPVTFRFRRLATVAAS